jgi:hypothetical protein
MSGLLDFREIPLAEVANIISPAKHRPRATRCLGIQLVVLAEYRSDARKSAVLLEVRAQGLQ